MKYLALTILIFISQAYPQEDKSISSSPYQFEITTPNFVLEGIPFKLEVSAKKSDGSVDTLYNGVPVFGNIRIEDKSKKPESRFQKGKFISEQAVVDFIGSNEITIGDGSSVGRKMLRSIPGLLSLLPPLLAIILALTIRQVIISLFAGVWLGAIFIFNYDPLGGLFRVVDHFILNSLKSPDHISIIIFSMMFGGMVGVITKNGGTLGIASLITRFAKTARGGQVSTWLLSIVLFFDDYANVLVRGNLMRPITDDLKISREKLSFIVDAGAATVASIFLISTWIGYEVGLIDQSLKAIGSTEDAYTVFLQTIPYRFYPILTLIFVLIIAISGRDFGPMLKAERRARFEGKVLRDGAQPATDVTTLTELSSKVSDGKWYNGLIPILTILIVGGYGLYTTGMENLRSANAVDFSLSSIISNSNSYTSLLWASFSACVVSILLSISQRILKLTEAIDAWFNGLRSMLFAMLILILAWSIGSVTEELRTADYLVQILRGMIEPHWLPVLTFLIAALISFATGTSWGTMAIMMPIVIPLSHNLSIEAGLIGSNYQMILHGVISSVLAGAVFGDHCSPISDTTVLSSMASACDHIDHVRTQLPYAILVAVVGMIVGDIPTAFGFSPYLSILIGVLFLIGFMYLFGKKVEIKQT
ncbi:MAG: Na+/H+ antiporter NhaC family protein [Bacteroidota bacterium]|nr:Na+/H+ antiporter NhaC family protein [Bacteroidota bacterium]